MLIWGFTGYIYILKAMFMFSSFICKNNSLNSSVSGQHNLATLNQGWSEQLATNHYQPVFNDQWYAGLKKREAEATIGRCKAINFKLFLRALSFPFCLLVFVLTEISFATLLVIGVVGYQSLCKSCFSFYLQGRLHPCQILNCNETRQDCVVEGEGWSHTINITGSSVWHWIA